MNFSIVMVLLGILRIFSNTIGRTFWQYSSCLLVCTFKALNRISSLQYMIVSAFFRLLGVWLDASTWTCMPQDELTKAPAFLTHRTTSWSFPISEYFQFRGYHFCRIISIGIYYSTFASLSSVDTAVPLKISTFFHLNLLHTRNRKNGYDMALFRTFFQSQQPHHSG